ncbi:MAG: hypothetical protein MHM6MM_008570, partial [Cercozoa sp. M6MM]
MMLLSRRLARRNARLFATDPAVLARKNPEFQLKKMGGTEKVGPSQAAEMLAQDMSEVAREERLKHASELSRQAMEQAVVNEEEPEMFALQTLYFTEDDIYEAAVLLNQLDDDDLEHLFEEGMSAEQTKRMLMQGGVELLRSRIKHLSFYEQAQNVLQEALDRYALQEEVDFAEVLKEVGVQLRLQKLAMRRNFDSDFEARQPMTYEEFDGTQSSKLLEPNVAIKWLRHLCHIRNEDDRRDFLRSAVEQGMANAYFKPLAFLFHELLCVPDDDASTWDMWHQRWLRMSDIPILAPLTREEVLEMRPVMRMLARAAAMDVCEHMPKWAAAITSGDMYDRINALSDAEFPRDQFDRYLVYAVCDAIHKTCAANPGLDARQALETFRQRQMAYLLDEDE